jgi:signal transduction histidine kinase
MINKVLRRLGTRIKFLIILFIIILVSTAVVTIYALNSGLAGTLATPLYAVIFFVMIASVIVGSFVSFSLGRFPINSIMAMTDAIDRLSSGDFSARLNIAGQGELRELEDSFNRMAKELGSIELLRSNFVNDFSHEFKTPIVSLIGFAEMLKYRNLTDEEKIEYLDIIISESKRLAALATNVLNLSKLEVQNFPVERKKFEVGEQIRRSILILESKWEEKNIALKIDIDDLYYSGNEELLNQVWVNLIDNAIKFTPDRGRVRITLKQVGEVLQFAVHDNGLGIGEEAKAHIFDKFYQADKSHATEGNGLGLALAKKIVELHGGGISCDSQAGRGSTFTVTLPLVYFELIFDL